MTITVILLVERDWLEVLGEVSHFRPSTSLNYLKPRHILHPTKEAQETKGEHNNFVQNICVLCTELTDHHTAQSSHGAMAPKLVYFSIYMIQFPQDKALFWIRDTNQDCFVDTFCDTSLYKGNIRGNEDHLRCVFVVVCLSWSQLLLMGIY